MLSPCGALVRNQSGGVAYGYLFVIALGIGVAMAISADILTIEHANALTQDVVRSNNP